MISHDLVTLFYLIASVCFIQALKGLSHPTTSRRGNAFGMVGMAIAIVTTASERLHRQSQKRVKGRTEGASLGPALAVGRASERRYRAGRLGRRIVTARAHYCFIVLEQ